MAPKRGGLGRGLDALIPTTAQNTKKKSETRAEDAGKETESKSAVNKQTTKADKKTKPAEKKTSAAGEGNTKAGAQKNASVKKNSTESTKPEKVKISVQEAKADEDPITGQVVMLRISQIEPNRAQPRKVFDREKLAELAASIREYGVVQPLLVQKKGNGYVIIAGERRWRASMEAGLKEVPVIIRDYSEQEVVEISLIENLQREDLNPIEEAEAYVRLMDEFNMTQEAVAGRVSKSRVAVTNSIRLLQLPQEVRDMLIYGDIREGHARAILGISDPEKQIEAARLVVKDGLSVRDTEKLTRTIQKPAQRRRKAAGFDDDVVYRDLEEQLKTRLGTKVTIARRTKDKGHIEIEYYSPADLERILDVLRGGEDVL